MKVAVIGAHGKVGRLLVPILVDQGHEVTGIVRHHEQLRFVQELGATPVELDVEGATREEVDGALAEHAAVVWTAGAGGGDPRRTYAVDRDGAITTMESAAAIGARRYVMVSWEGSRPDHGVDPHRPFFAYADAKAAADEHLRGTSLDWTILGPATLSDHPGRGRIGLLADGEEAPASPGVPRGDVALVAATALTVPETVHRFVRFTAGSTLVVEALTGRQLPAD